MSRNRNAINLHIDTKIRELMPLQVAFSEPTQNRFDELIQFISLPR